jgi:hypothetical protein
MAASLMLCPPPACEPTAKEMLQAIKDTRERYFSRLADNLAVARIIWRDAPQMVEAEDFPQPYLTAFRRWNKGEHPEENIGWENSALQPDFEELVLTEARDFAITRHHARASARNARRRAAVARR